MSLRGPVANNLFVPSQSEVLDADDPLVGKFQTGSFGVQGVDDDNSKFQRWGGAIVFVGTLIWGWGDFKWLRAIL